MTRVISRSIVIDNLDHRVIVLADGSRLKLSVSQFMKNEVQVFCDFSGSICGNKFSFCGALCTNRLCARATSHNTTGQTAPIVSHGATLMQFIGVGRINNESEMQWWRNDWKGLIKLQRIIGHLGKRVHWF